jgi:hypothetical protein
MILNIDKDVLMNIFFITKQLVVYLSCERIFTHRDK